jgi:hypothetical protein
MTSRSRCLVLAGKADGAYGSPTLLSTLLKNGHRGE